MVLIRRRHGLPTDVVRTIYDVDWESAHMPDLFIPEGCGIGFTRFRLAGDPEEMVVTIGLDTRVAGGTAQELSDGMDAAATATGSLAPAASAIIAGYEYVGTKVILTTSAGLDIGQTENIVTGTDSSVGILNNTAILVRKNTASAGRWNRGRCFFPPIWIGNEDASLTGVLASGALTAVQDRITAWVIQLRLIAELDELVLLHYPRTDPPSPSPDPTPDPTNLTTLIVQNKLATMRQRMRP